MDNCIICLESTNILSRISTDSSEWIEGEMQRKIEKHLWWWYMKPLSQNNGIVRWICRQCWQEINTFHNFYTKVETAHRYYQPIMTILKQIKKERQKSPNNDSILVKVQRKERPRREDKRTGKLEKIMEVENETECCVSLNECDTNEEYTKVSYSYEDTGGNDSYNQGVEENQNNCNVTPSEKSKQKTRNPGKAKLLKHKSIQKQSIKLKKSTKRKTIHIDQFFKESQHNLECCICNIPLSDFRALKVHCRDKHNIQGYAMCCGKKYFKRCLLVDHLRVHSDPNFFKCQSCTKTFATRRGLEMHLESHEARERKYNCDECGKSYFKLHVFERHKLTHVPESDRNFKCSQCDKKFASDYIRRQHEDTTHAKKYAKICDICGKSFCHSYSFLRHMEEHAGAPPSMETCDICGVKLTNKYGLRQHMKMRHLKENLQEQVCPYCSRVSPNLNAHRMHIKYTHTMQRKHACHLCEKAFRRPLELKEHLSTHTGEALYTCPHCPRTFISNANMHKHRKIAHRKEWEERRLKKMCRSGVKPESISKDDTIPIKSSPD